MSVCYTPRMRTVRELLNALESERTTFAASNVMDRAKLLIERLNREDKVSLDELIDPTPRDPR